MKSRLNFHTLLCVASLVLAIQISALANATDCSITPTTSYCWKKKFKVTTASLASNGWKIISSSLAEITSEKEILLSQRAFLEITYWQKGKVIMLCRSTIRDDTSRTRMTGSICYNSLKPSERTKR